MSLPRQERLVRYAFLPRSRMGEVEVAFGDPQVHAAGLVERVAGGFARDRDFPLRIRTGD